MKAITQTVYGESDVLALTDEPVPTLGKNDVLVRVHTAGVDRGVWHIMSGKPRLARLFIGRTGPRDRTRGRDVAGTIEAVGTEVTRFRIGDEVFGTADGSFAEYARTTEKRLAHKPAELSFADAAALPFGACAALLAVRAARVSEGHRVLVLGASGGVGAFAVQLAVVAGGTVTAVASAAKLDFVRSLGATHAIDYVTGSLDGTYDAIIDIAGNRSLTALRALLTPAGTLVIVGGESGGEIFGGLERNLAAAVQSPFTRQRLVGLVSAERPADLEHLAALVVAGSIHSPIDRIFPLAETAAAVQYVVDGHARGKVVVTV